MKRHVTYANVAATLALIFSMAGGALAASHYLITSTKQIKPSVLRAIRGPVRVVTAVGPKGATGPEGYNPVPGPRGFPGERGPEGPRGLSIVNEPGARGPQGEQGPQGERGPSGPLGGTGGAGITGAAGPPGEKGATGPAGPPGTGGTGGGGVSREECEAVGGPPERINCFLKSKGTETGGWSATMRGATGTEQVETQGVASFPIPLKVNEKVKLNYRNEEESKTATAPCLGSPNEPFAEPGNLCAYRGGAGLGSKEKGEGSIDRNAKFSRFEDFSGESFAETGLANSGDEGVDIVFRTTEYNEETPIKSLKAEADLNAKGSWAVTAK